MGRRRRFPGRAGRRARPPGGDSRRSAGPSAWARGWQGLSVVPLRWPCSLNALATIPVPNGVERADQPGARQPARGPVPGAETGVEHLPGHITIALRIRIARLDHDLPRELRSVLISEGRQRSVGNRNQEDVSESERLFDGTSRGVGPAVSNKCIKMIRMAGAETNLVARDRKSTR